MINGILLSENKTKNPKKQQIQNINESLKHYAKQSKSGTRSMLYISMWMKVKDRQNLCTVIDISMIVLWERKERRGENWLEGGKTTSGVMGIYTFIWFTAGRTKKIYQVVHLIFFLLYVNNTQQNTLSMKFFFPVSENVSSVFKKYLVCSKYATKIIYYYQFQLANLLEWRGNNHDYTWLRQNKTKTLKKQPNKQKTKPEYLSKKGKQTMTGDYSHSVERKTPYKVYGLLSSLYFPHTVSSIMLLENSRDFIFVV